MYEGNEGDEDERNLVLKTERVLVLEKESTLRISTKWKEVCGTLEKRRERER